MPNWFTKPVFSKRWWKETAETAWFKIKNNAQDLVILAVGETCCLLLSASNPIVTGILTCISIALSGGADFQHTREKLAIFLKLKTQLEDKDILPPSKVEEYGIRLGGFIISGIALTGYAICVSLKLPVAVEWTCVSFAMCSCHIGRKIYDMKLGKEIEKMERKRDIALGTLPQINGKLEAREARYKRSVENLRVYLQDIKMPVPQQERLLEVLISERTEGGTQSTLEGLDLLHDQSAEAAAPTERAEPFIGDDTSAEEARFPSARSTDGMRVPILGNHTE